jgi:hypothetical protein
VLESASEAVAVAVDTKLAADGFGARVCAALAATPGPQQAPPDVGDAVWLPSASAPSGGVLAMVVRTDGGECVPQAVLRAVTHALEIAQRRRLGSLAFAGIPTPAEQQQAVAAAMVRACKEHRGDLPEFVVLTDTDDSVVRAWRAALESST